MRMALRFIKNIIGSNDFWVCSVIISGFLPIILEDVIIGFLIAFIPVCIILIAKRASIPRIEWIIVSLIVLVFFSLFLFLSLSLIYPIVIYAIGFFVAYFSFKNHDFSEDKIRFKEQVDKYDSFIYGEMPPSILQNKTDVSMCFYNDGQYLGVAVPVARYGYNFIFYGIGEKCSNLYNSNKSDKWKLSFIFPIQEYNLDEENANLLIIRSISWWKINISFYNGDSLVIPLYKRNVELLSKYGVSIKFGLYAEGVIVRHSRLTDKKMELSISCLVYFLWLIVFGANRTDY